MWDNFWRVVIYGILALALVGCVSCSMFGGGELSDEDFIKAVAAAGCNLKTIERDDGEVGDISCLETVKVLHSK